MIDVIVIGGGAAGMAAAGKAAQCGADVMLLERNEKTGKKLYITGKGRCNVTNDTQPREFLENVVNGKKFLYGSIYSYSPAYTISFFEESGLKLKTERGNRVFPATDKSSDVIKALNDYLRRGGVEVRLNVKVQSVKAEQDGFGVFTDSGTFRCKKLIIACGGKSYPSTGSDGSGYKLAAMLGHTVVKPVAALVPIRLKENVAQLQGLSLKNVKVSVCGKDFCESGFGEMLFTADGVSGPVVLSLSSLINKKDLTGAKLIIDLKPALDKSKLDERLLSDFKKYSNKMLRNSLGDLLPKSLIPFIIEYCKLDGDKPLNIVTKAERGILLNALKCLTFHIHSLYDVEFGIVTAGGVELKEINSKTMESKLVKNLYFAGEMMDVDALTGGFNIQIALSTGFAAGKSAGGDNGD